MASISLLVLREIHLVLIQTSICSGILNLSRTWTAQKLTHCCLFTPMQQCRLKCSRSTFLLKQRRQKLMYYVLPGFCVLTVCLNSLYVCVWCLVCVYAIPGEDGPSQMALEDLAMFRAIPTATVFYPSDGVSTEKAVELAANTKVLLHRASKWTLAHLPNTG